MNTIKKQPISLNNKTILVTGVAGNSLQRSFIHDRARSAGAFELMNDVGNGLLIRKSLIIVMNSDSLTQCFMYGTLQCPVQMGLAAQDQRETVDRSVTVVHQHLDVIEDAG